MADPGSLFSLYRRLLHLRRVTPALLHGSYEDLAPDHPSCLVYRRRLPDPNADEWIVAANFSARPQPLAMPGVRAAAMVLSTDGARAGTRLDPPVLHPEEGLLLRRSARPSRAA
jgi:glycosidase